MVLQCVELTVKLVGILLCSGEDMSDWLSFILVIVAIGGLSLLMKTTKTGLVPSEDMGTVFINVQASPGTNLQETYKIVKEVEKRIKDMPQLRI